MKKRVLSKIVMVGTAVLLLAAMMVSTLLGTTSAMYEKSLSQKLDIKATPDLALRYYIGDSNPDITNGIYVLENIETIKQDIGFKGKSGSGVVYQIAIPVYETGIYNLKFGIRITSDAKDTDLAPDINNPVGCQVISQGDTDKDGKEFKFGTNTYFRIAEDTRISQEDAVDEQTLKNKANPTAAEQTKYEKLHKTSTDMMFESKKFFYAYDNYQWKTLAPSRYENVELAFVVDSDDLKVGYVMWVWDFMGLTNPLYPNLVKYTIELDHTSWDKVSDLTRNDAYIDFANMSYKNNCIVSTYQASTEFDRIRGDDSKPTPASGTQPRRFDTYVQGHNVAGITRETGGRGTYVTSVSTNSMTMQAEPLYFGYRYKACNIGSNTAAAKLAAEQPWVGSDDEKIEKDMMAKGGDYAKNWNTSILDFSNPIVFNIPIKNIEAKKTYKVTFDFSVARQGKKEVLDGDGGKETNVNAENRFVDYQDDVSKFFGTNDAAKLNFQSYFYPSRVQGYGIETTHGNTSVRGKYSYANKKYNTHWLTSYNEVTLANASGTVSAALNNSIVSSVNTPSWYNAVKTEETNGEYAITWLTFKNTTFSFNIQGTNNFKSDNVTVQSITDLNGKLNVYWVWAIDALCPSAWFRIKIDNVRLEEVVDYGSGIGNSTYAGIAIGEGDDTKNPTFADQVTDAINNTEIVSNTKANQRGANGTGQNFATRMYSALELPELNIYGPIYDMSDYKVKDKDDYKIYLSGYCTVKGGVDRYVWSADGGKTWYDMIENSENPPGNDGGAVLITSERRVDTYNYGTHEMPYKDSKGVAHNPTDFIEFTTTDQIKCDFRGYRIHADLSETKYYEQPNLDIIFAAVPRDNPNLRCEILRITNFNAVQNYRTYTREIISDIVVGSTGTNLTAHYNADASATPTPHNTEIFTKFYSVNYPGYVANAGGYALRATYYHDYADIRTIYSDIPVKTQLTIRGWAMIDTGIEGFYWSPDDGVTWYPCSDDTGSFNAGAAGISTGMFGTSSSKDSQRYSWYDGKYENPGGDFCAKLYFDDASKGQGLTANLSAFAGKTIDVIFAAKSNAGGPYCPIGKIDNVAVYGDGSTDKPNDRGTFFTRVNKIIVDGATVSPFTAKYSDGTTLTYLDKWNLGTNLGYGGDHDEYLISGLTYTPFEVCNTDIFHVRKASATPILVKNGGNIKISGFTFCPKGVNQYRYTLNGGITWRYIDAASIAEYYPSGTGVALTRAQRVDSTFTAKDGDNGNYIDSTEYYDSTNFAWTPLTINLPNNLAQGEVRDLLVVAESNNASDEPSGKLYPVFHQTIKVAGGDELVHNDSITSSNASLATTVANLQKSSYTLNYSAIPEIKMEKTAYYPSSYYESSLSVPKMYFFEGEDIPVTYSAQGTSTAEKGAWICITTTDNKYIRWRYVANNSADTFNINECTEPSQDGVDEDSKNLKAGDYKIWFVDNDKWFSNSKTTAEVWDNVVTEPISIKIIKRDYSDNINWGVTHNYISKTVNGETLTGSISLEKTTFIQGDDIEVTVTGASAADGVGVMWYTIVPYGEWEFDGNIDHWSYADAVDDPLKTSDLAPGQYMLYYVSGSRICTGENSALDEGTIHTIIDITILPDEPSSTCTLTYTDSMGTTQTKEIEAIGFHNYDIKDMQLDVKTGTSVQIITEYENFVGITDVKRNFELVSNT